MPGRGTTDAIFIVRQLQEKFLAKNKNLYLAFVDLEKAFDRVPRQVLWWAMRKLGIDEWIVQLVQAMYCELRSKVHIDNCFSDSFNVNVGVHQGSVLSPLLFIIVLEALSHEFRTGSQWELLYADDLVIMAETIEELSQKLDAWKVNLEKKGLRVNMKKTNRYINIMTRGKIFNVCVGSVLLYGSECWAMRKKDKARLERNDRAMLRWICGVKISDRVSVDSLYQRLEIAPLTTLLRSRRLRWFGYVSRSDSWINQCRNLDATGKRGKGVPHKS